MWRRRRGPDAFHRFLVRLVKTETLYVHTEIERLGTESRFSSCAPASQMVADALAAVLALVDPERVNEDEPISLRTLPTAEVNVLLVALHLDLVQRLGERYLKGASTGTIVVFEDAGPIWFTFNLGFDGIGQHLTSYTSADMRAAVFFKLRHRSVVQ